MIKKLNVHELIYLHDIEFQASKYYVTNFSNVNDSFLDDYVKFETEQQAKDKVNKSHNFGRLIKIPFKMHLYENLDIKKQKNIFILVLLKFYIQNNLEK